MKHTSIFYGIIFCFFACFLITKVKAQEKKELINWQLNDYKNDLKVGEVNINNARLLEADLSQLKDQLFDLEIRSKSKPTNAKKQIEIIGINGSVQIFEVEDAGVMHPDLQAQFPAIRSFKGRGVDDPLKSIRIDISQRGFYAMISSPSYDDYLIAPVDNEENQYAVFLKKDYPKDNHQFACGVESDSKNKGDSYLNSNDRAYSTDCLHRTYRLAVACTGEYGAFHGGVTANALAAIVLVINRVNEVYERDLSVTLELVADNADILYMDAASDPYTSSNFNNIITKNQEVCDDNIGNQNYDVGHVFTVANEGLASFECVCDNDYKAIAGSGLNNPIGDPFAIDYVAHEIGHQFGANHTQNNPCSSTSYTSVEPGSASTIMGYAGICWPNVQMNSDDYFNSINIQQILYYNIIGWGSTCGTAVGTNNNSPGVYAGADYIIPVQTPFELTGEAIDDDGDVLTYCWEQQDVAEAEMPPIETETVGPAFRSYEPSYSPTRVFPNLADLINNIDPTWEELPAFSRSMNFACTVRDNHPGNGCVTSDDMELTFDDSAGPFLVNYPNTGVNWEVGDTETITWEVANTDQAPINTTLVDIYLSTDGGYTYPYLLATNTPNDGTEAITVPNLIGNNNRIKIKGVDNVFFDISNTDFNIGNCTNCVNLDLKVYLNGAFANSPNTLMRDDLRAGGYIPLIEPYGSAANFGLIANQPNYSTTQTVLDQSGSNAIVDWVLVELRAANDPSNIVASRSLLLQRDGDVVDIDGISLPIFKQSPNNYYVSVKHRNHLGIMTDNAISLSNSSPLIDFTTNTPTYGQFAQTTVSGINAMWSGNTNQDQSLIFQGPTNDINQVFFQVLTNPLNTTMGVTYILPGYYNEDINMDALTIYQGPDNENNYLFFNILTHPSSQGLIIYTIQEQLP